MPHESFETSSSESESDKIRERFLKISPRIIGKLLENNPSYFDSLSSDDTSSGVLRKFSETISELNESGYPEQVDKLEAMRDVVYQNIESKREPAIFEGFAEEQKEAVMGNLGAIELTKGCSAACPFCAFEAERGVKGSMAFADLVYLARHYASVLVKDAKAFYLFWASDPLDYEDGDRNYADVVELFASYVALNYETRFVMPVPRPARDKLQLASNSN